MGGRGGYSFDGDRDVGGMGGAALRAPEDALLFGGGGGAGHVNDATDAAGGRGGGIIFVRARRLEGAGLLDASGGPGKSVYVDGAGGGGAGGTIHLRVSETAACSEARAVGGAGGQTLERCCTGRTIGPGGGGGGGRVRVQAEALACALRAESGPAGLETDTDGGMYGARGAEPAAGSAAYQGLAVEVLDGGYGLVSEPPPRRVLRVGCAAPGPPSAVVAVLVVLAFAARRLLRRGS